MYGEKEQNMKAIGNWFSNQKPTSKLTIGGIGLLIVFGVCGLMAVLLTRSTRQQVPSSTATFQGADSVIFITSTPAPPTLTPTPNGSETPTDTPLPTASPTASSTPTATEAPLPTGLPTRSFETPTIVVLPATLSAATVGALVIIIYVDRELEFVDIQNAGNSPASLRGWTLVSETGHQVCSLRGILQAKEILRIWAGIGQVGISCEFKNPIWAEEVADPAVLYNAKNEEVSRYP